MQSHRPFLAFFLFLLFFIAAGSVVNAALVRWRNSQTGEVCCTSSGCYAPKGDNWEKDSESQNCSGIPNCSDVEKVTEICTLEAGDDQGNGLESNPVVACLGYLSTLSPQAFTSALPPMSPREFNRLMWQARRMMQVMMGMAPRTMGSPRPFFGPSPTPKSRSPDNQFFQWLNLIKGRLPDAWNQ